MNTRASRNRDTQGQVGQRKKELANKLPFSSQANSLPKVTQRCDIRVFENGSRKNRELESSFQVLVLTWRIVNLESLFSIKLCNFSIFQTTLSNYTFSKIIQEAKPQPSANDLAAKIPAGIPDIDANNKAEECGPYARHNFSYLRYLEVKHQTKGTESLENAGILPKWRVILVDWLREISQKLNGQCKFYKSQYLLSHYLSDQ